MFGIKIRREHEPADHGALRLIVNEHRAFRELEILHPLTNEETGPALTKAFVATNEMTEKTRKERVSRVLAAGRKRAGILARVSGKALAKEEEALGQVPSQVFRGPNRRVTATVNGDFAVINIDVAADVDPAEAVAKAADAIEAACKVAEEGWYAAVKKVSEESKDALV